MGVSSKWSTEKFLTDVIGSSRLASQSGLFSVCKMSLGSPRVSSFRLLLLSLECSSCKLMIEVLT